MILTPYNYPPFWQVYWQEKHSLIPRQAIGNYLNNGGNVYLTADPENGDLVATDSLDEALEMSEFAKSSGLDFDNDNSP